MAWSPFNQKNKNQTATETNSSEQKTNDAQSAKPVDEKIESEIARLKQTLNNVTLVNELGQRVTSSLSLNEAFSHLYHTLNSMMDVSIAELAVYNDFRNQQFFFSNFNNQWVGSNKIPEHNHMAEWCYKNKRELFLNDAENDFGRYVFAPLIFSDGKMAQSIMCFPVESNEQIIGTISIISFNKNAYENFHIEMIRLLLPFLAVSLQNSFTHQELIITKMRAENSEKFMQQFLANMSHEIRTPMNAVMGMTNILLDKNPTVEQETYLTTIRKSSENLLVILNDILDLSKIEAGKIELEQIDFALTDIAKNLKEIMQFKAEEKGLTLSMKVDENIPPVLIGDPTRLSQILINLIGNAIKFTEEGDVVLTISSVVHASGQSAETHEVHFAVSDTGIGMDAEQQKKLFQNYVQASAETTRKYGGTGLGLSISKQLVELQGGNISIKSIPRMGSTFSFSLTYAVSKNKTVVKKEKLVSKEMARILKGIRILLVDDNEFNRIVAKETLKLKIEDLHIDEAVDGLQAIEQLKQNDYDVVLMDLVMPNLNGLDATRRIRAEFPSPKRESKILALTASVVKSELDKCFEAGMDGYVPKPFKWYEILGGIYNVIHNNISDLEEQEITEQPAAIQTGKTVNLNYLNEFAEGDQERVKKYVDMFLNKVPLQIQALNDALQRSDYDKIRITSHSMKPQLRFVGVQEGLEIAEHIEQLAADKIELNQIPNLISQLDKICSQASEELQTISF